jgi:alpha-L-fucosidase
MDADNLQSLALPEEKKAWFVHDRFGMFVHWGLYALPARHEWVKSREELNDADYQRYFDHFDPDLYHPREWARRAKAAGMKYVVLTTKHHDGFCLWDTKATDFKVPNTPYGRDLLGPFVDAFRAEGLRIGFYYSLIDWHHPDFTVDPRHPQRNHADALKINEGRDMHHYAAFMREQVRELLTEFGQIDIMWFDFSYPQWKLGELVGKGHRDWESEKLVRLVRELAPDIIINNRLDLAGLQPDIVTPEQYMPRRLGSLPHAQRLLGLSPRRRHVEEHRATGADARRHRCHGRQSADECRANGARHARPACDCRPCCL